MGWRMKGALASETTRAVVEISLKGMVEGMSRSEFAGGCEDMTAMRSLKISTWYQFWKSCSIGVVGEFCM